MEYNYTAIVLKKRKIGETDRLYTFYTLEAGKLQSIGRGIRKPQAKLAGHLETLNQTDIIVARRRGLGNIASAITERYFQRVKDDASVLGRVLSAIDTFERLVDFEEKDEELFFLLQSYLAAVDNADQRRFEMLARIVTQGFLFRMFDRLGYRMEMKVCMVSGRALSSSLRYVFSPEAGGLIESRLAGRSRDIVPVSVNAIKLIRLFAHNNLASLHRIHIDHVDLSNVEHVSKAFLRWIGR